ncbi:hypothetical protein [Actinokineospora sp.]|uniref:hypothetical protein n=1 Tax=Actinokineospora sp. TaxID=1872133 RepID=UPI003D6A173D
MAVLWLPASVCQHPAEAIVGELNPPAISVMCARCGGAWDETNAPGPVIDSLYEVLERGLYRPMPKGVTQL